MGHYASEMSPKNKELDLLWKRFEKLKRRLGRKSSSQLTIKDLEMALRFVAGREDPKPRISVFDDDRILRKLAEGISAMKRLLRKVG